MPTMRGSAAAKVDGHIPSSASMRAERTAWTSPPRPDGTRTTSNDAATSFLRPPCHETPLRRPQDRRRRQALLSMPSGSRQPANPRASRAHFPHDPEPVRPLRIASARCLAATSRLPARLLKHAQIQPGIKAGLHPASAPRPPRPPPPKRPQALTFPAQQSPGSACMRYPRVAFDRDQPLARFLEIPPTEPHTQNARRHFRRRSG
jgi:hypothetical protein